MERVLDVYARHYDERFPVLCFDEQPCFLIGDAMAPVPMEPGRVAKQDYEYQRFGSCALLLTLKNPALKVQGFKVRLKVAVNATVFRL